MEEKKSKESSPLKEEEKIRVFETKDVYVADLENETDAEDALIEKVKEGGQTFLYIAGGRLHEDSDMSADVTGIAGRRLFIIETPRGERKQVGATELVIIKNKSGLNWGFAPLCDFDDFGTWKKITAEAFKATPLGSALREAIKRSADKKSKKSVKK